MKAVIQRVSSASVTVDGEVVSSIGRGLCVLVGIHRDDTAEQARAVARKVLAIRAFEEDVGGGKPPRRWAKGVADLGLEVLCVSQFTLYHVMKGNKPDFHLAMGGEDSKKLYEVSDLDTAVQLCSC